MADALAFGPRVRATLCSTRTDPPEVWVVERDLGEARGTCFERHIEVIPSAVEYHLAHELVHWYVPGSPYDELPHFVEEGLADFVALELLGLTEARKEEHRRIGDLTVRADGLNADDRTWSELPADEERMLTRLGFEVVSRVGLDRLRTLAADRAGPLTYLEAAGLEGRVASSQAASEPRH